MNQLFINSANPSLSWPTLQPHVRRTFPPSLRYNGDTPRRFGLAEMSNNNTLGTLIVVVIRARHLPDRSRIGVGKPSPYTTLTYGLTKHQTKPIKRGGQTPQFDEEFRFEVPTQEEDFLTNETASISKSGGIVPITASSAPVVSNSQHPTINSGRKALRIALFADDSKAPRMIGEAVLDLSAVFVKGEHDGTFSLFIIKI